MRVLIHLDTCTNVIAHFAQRGMAISEILKKLILFGSLVLVHLNLPASDDLVLSPVYNTNTTMHQEL